MTMNRAEKITAWRMFFAALLSTRPEPRHDERRETIAELADAADDALMQFITRDDELMFVSDTPFVDDAVAP